MSTGPDVVRRILINARRETVFRFFTESEQWAAWWGAGSTIDPRPGGAATIVYPGGVRASGIVKEIVAAEKFVFSFGFDEGKPIAAGASTVTITLADEPGGTRVTLQHTGLPDEKATAEFEQGWRYQMSLFSVAATNVEHAEVNERADRWLTLWGEADEATRRRALEVAADDVTFHDRYSAVFGKSDLDAHASAAAIHMPGVRLFRTGDAVAAHGTALVHWEARTPDKTVGKGTNVIDFAPDGRIRRVVGFWSA